MLIQVIFLLKSLVFKTVSVPWHLRLCEDIRPGVEYPVGNIIYFKHYLTENPPSTNKFVPVTQREASLSR